MQIDVRHAPLALPNRTVRIRQKADGALLLDYLNYRLSRAA